MRSVFMVRSQTNLKSRGDRGGSEEPIAQHPVRTQAYYKYVEERDSVASCKDAATTKVYT